MVTDVELLGLWEPSRVIMHSVLREQLKIEFGDLVSAYCVDNDHRVLRDEHPLVVEVLSAVMRRA